MTDYLYAVDDDNAAAGHSARAAAAVHAAMPRLEEDVRSLLSSSLRRFSISSDDIDDATPSASPRHGTLSPDATASVRGVADQILLGVEAVAIEEVTKMEWSVLDQKMRRWSHAVRAVVRTFLADERLLCDEVFELDEELGHECFAYIARGMFEALTDVQPELEALFSGDAARDFFTG
ncbi:exocyst complex component EXO70A1-like [Setaria italica]|uniref:exocyst complex component EXO70A1-like n=1 Tax=Setaria italica TaxID=4555 RepID=UPI000648A602|nr:exocyst complex component EXO70A1-like [Setaria italica]